MLQTHGGGEDATGKDWLFDYLLSVFKSPQWDVAVMGFIDENCAVFDNDEENKLAYTDLHHQFKDLVRAFTGRARRQVCVVMRRAESYPRRAACSTKGPYTTIRYVSLCIYHLGDRIRTLCARRARRLSPCAQAASLR